MDLKARKKVQSGATTGNGEELDLRTIGGRRLLALIQGSAGVSAGAVTLEQAIDPGYTGTWEPLGAAVTVVASTTDSLSVDGPFSVVRARISTNVVGGTVTVVLVVI
jgi:hypothetical protein